MEHYFSNNSQKEHEYRNINYSLNNSKFTFVTDNSVFSKNRVDFGSDLLNKTVVDFEENIESLLEIGCGYGPMTLSIDKVLNIGNVDMVDVNERALNLAKINAENNNIKNANIYISNIYESVNNVFEVIISNPPIRAGKKVVTKILEESKKYLKKGGRIYIVIQKKQGAQSAKKVLLDTYGNCEVINKKAGFWILVSKNRSEE